MKRINLLLLTVFPILLFLTGIHLKTSIPNYSLCSVDPEFCYLFNGLNMAYLNFPWHIDHPGTTLQILSAIVIRIVHLFHNHSVPLMQDVFMYPDFYLNRISASLILLDAISLLILGFITYKTSKNIFQSLFLQLLPFVSFTMLEITRRVMVEHLMLYIGMCLVAAIILYINKTHEDRKLFNKHIILLGILTGLGVATKITFFPLVFVPFFIISGIRKKFAYMAIFIVSTMVFVSPIFNRWVYFREWIINLFVHSGQYGSGEANIVDVKSFIANLKIIFTQEFFYPKVFLLFIIGLVIYFIPFLKVKRKDDIYFRGLIGILFAMILLTVLVAKQFKYFYLVPVLLLMIPGLYFIIKIYSRSMPGIAKSRFFSIVILLLFSGLIYLQIGKRLIGSIENPKDRSIYNTIQVVDEKYRSLPTCILPNYYYSPYPEYSLFFGTAWCGPKMKAKYAPTLIQLYPNTYIYHNWNQLFNYWDNQAISFIDLLKKHNYLILYIGDPSWEQPFFTKHYGVNRMLDTHLKKAYFNEGSKETLYELEYDTSAIFTGLSCDAENIDESGIFFITKEGVNFENGYTQSQEQYRSGKYSSKLTKDTPYGMTAVLSEVCTGDRYSISCWRYNNGNKNACLVVSEYDKNEYYSAITNVVDSLDKWQKIETNFHVNDNLHSKSIKIYCYNPNPDIPAYFDDMSIVKINP